MSAHTPGPWFVSPGDEWTAPDGLRVQFGEYRISAGYGDEARYYRIGAVSNINDSSQNIANAHLIAAAPELLQAARDARGLLAHAGCPVDWLDAAIAKATGSAA